MNRIPRSTAIEPRVATAVGWLGGVVGGVRPVSSPWYMTFYRGAYQTPVCLIQSTSLATARHLSDHASPSLRMGLSADLAFTLKRGIGGGRLISSASCSASNHEAYPTRTRVAQPSSLVTPLHWSDRARRSLVVASCARLHNGPRWAEEGVV